MWYTSDTNPHQFMSECGNSMSTFYEMIDMALMTSVAEQFSAEMTPQVRSLRATNWVFTSRVLDRQWPDDMVEEAWELDVVFDTLLDYEDADFRL